MANTIDLDELKPSDMGNFISRTYVGEANDNKPGTTNEKVDYGDLPSRALTELGKQTLVNQTDQDTQ